jgi:hypothetical protein
VQQGRPFRVTATGQAFDAGVNVTTTMIGARLFGGSAASSAIIRETDGSGTILAELQCPAAGADESRIPVSFKQKLHVTLAGTGASCTVYVP